jgi:hypothetical protein
MHHTQNVAVSIVVVSTNVCAQVSASLQCVNVSACMCTHNESVCKCTHEAYEVYDACVMYCYVLCMSCTCKLSVDSSADIPPDKK